MIEDWIDKVANVWRISDPKFGTVLSFKLIEKAEFPNAIDPASLSKQPIALTVPAWTQPQYSVGGPRIAFYTGVTEFHVAPSVNRSLVPSLMPWPGLIIRAAAASMRLGGAVEYFGINMDRQDAIIGPISLRYGSEEWHWGFLVNWVVKEQLGSSITVSA